MEYNNNKKNKKKKKKKKKWQQHEVEGRIKKNLSNKNILLNKNSNEK